MALCDNCLFYREDYDEFRQNYDDTEKVGDNTIKHYCPMYDDNIPNGIFYGGENCEFFDERGIK